MRLHTTLQKPSVAHSPEVSLRHTYAGKRCRKSYCLHVMMSGFTLVEMLVSIVVVAILVAAIIVISGNVIEHTNFVKCVTNLRQIGIGYSLYLQDNDNQFPPYYAAPVPSRTGAIRPYLDLTKRPQNEGVLACPSAQPVLEDAYPSNPYERYSYHQNRAWASSPTSRNHLNFFQNPGKAILVFERWGAPDRPPTTPNTHEKGRNILYVDFHVESRKDLIPLSNLDDALHDY